MPVCEFFASQNTSEGFRSRFDEIFSEDRLQHLYVIKGGPGTGKSHLMKQIAARWEKDGAAVERFLCSSDPDSLDGILHKERGIAVVDGTSPHTKESKYPGCVGTLWNTGAFWDTKLLENSREEILTLCAQKERSYELAYTYLRAMGQMAQSRRRLALGHLNREKLLAAARRFLAKELAKSGQGQRSVRLQASYGKKGLHKLRSFEALAKRRCLVCDHYGTGSVFLDVLQRESSLNCLCSYSPLYPNTLDGLFFPQLELCVVCDRKEDWEASFSQADRYVNMERFLNTEALRSHRQKLRFAAKCKESLEEGAVEAFEKAAMYHRKLEEIYSSAMDFSALSRFERDVEQKLR